MDEIKTDIINRELSWVDFNTRVLEEAERCDNTICERLKFLSITSTNLDEFFAVRVARLKRAVASGGAKADNSGYTPKQLDAALGEKLKKFYDRQYRCFNRLMQELLKSGTEILRTNQMCGKQREFVYEYYCRDIRPRTEKLSDTIYILLETYGGEYRLTPVPMNVPRICEIPCREGRAFALLEDIIIYCLMRDDSKIKNGCVFRITRDADVIVKDGADMHNEVSRVLEKRRNGRIVRVETERGRGELICGDIYCTDGPIDLSFTGELTEILGESECIASANTSYMPREDIFEIIRQSDRLVYHPYDSFGYVIDFINRAAEDECVTEIKQTVYRVSENSPIMTALLKAASLGKKVSVMVELKARFDEENNLQWAEKLQKAGCNIIYGSCGYKTHCKLLSVVRQEGEVRRTYLHIATGNYNEVTAEGYTDMGIFTCRENFAADAELLFKKFDGGTEQFEFKRFVTAPESLRSFFERKIEIEIQNAKQGLPCGIFMKMNSLSDPKIIRQLYRASECGVPVKLLVRGICCLIPQKEHLSENIEVYSIVGHYLEHSRIFRFESAGRAEVWIGSADLMPRNLNRRIELVFPVEDGKLKEKIDGYIETMLADNRNMRVMDGCGAYSLQKTEGEVRDSQKELYELINNTGGSVRSGTVTAP